MNNKLTAKNPLWKEIPEPAQSQISGGAKERFVRTKPHVNVSSFSFNHDSGV